MEAAVRVAERSRRAVSVAQLQREEFFTGADREPHRPLAPAVLARPAPDDLETQRLDVEPLRRREVLDLDGEVVVAVHGERHRTARMRRTGTPRKRVLERPGP